MTTKEILQAELAALKQKNQLLVKAYNLNFDQFMSNNEKFLDFEIDNELSHQEQLIDKITRQYQANQEIQRKKRQDLSQEEFVSQVDQLRLGLNNLVLIMTTDQISEKNQKLARLRSLISQLDLDRMKDYIKDKIILANKNRQAVVNENCTLKSLILEFELNGTELIKNLSPEVACYVQELFSEYKSRNQSICQQLKIRRSLLSLRIKDHKNELDLKKQTMLETLNQISAVQIQTTQMQKILQIIQKSYQAGQRHLLVNFRFQVQKIDRKLKKIEDINTYELKIKILKKENEDLKKQLKQNQETNQNSTMKDSRISDFAKFNSLRDYDLKNLSSFSIQATEKIMPLKIPIPEYIEKHKQRLQDNNQIFSEHQAKKNIIIGQITSDFAESIEIRMPLNPENEKNGPSSTKEIQKLIGKEIRKFFKKSSLRQQMEPSSLPYGRGQAHPPPPAPAGRGNGRIPAGPTPPTIELGRGQTHPPPPAPAGRGNGRIPAGPPQPSNELGRGQAHPPPPAPAGRGNGRIPAGPPPPSIELGRGQAHPPPPAPAGRGNGRIPARPPPLSTELGRGQAHPPPPAPTVRDNGRIPAGPPPPPAPVGRGNGRMPAGPPPPFTGLGRGQTHPPPPAPAGRGNGRVPVSPPNLSTELGRGQAHPPPPAPAGRGQARGLKAPPSLSERGNVRPTSSTGRGQVSVTAPSQELQSITETKTKRNDYEKYFVREFQKKIKKFEADEEAMKNEEYRNNVLNLHQVLAETREKYWPTKDLSMFEQLDAAKLASKPIIFSNNRPPIKDPKTVQKQPSAQQSNIQKQMEVRKKMAKQRNDSEEESDEDSEEEQEMEGQKINQDPTTEGFSPTKTEIYNMNNEEDENRNYLKTALKELQLLKKYQGQSEDTLNCTQTIKAIQKIKQLLNNTIVTEDVINSVADVLTLLNLTKDTPTCIQIKQHVDPNSLANAFSARSAVFQQPTKSGIKNNKYHDNDSESYSEDSNDSDNESD